MVIICLFASGSLGLAHHAENESELRWWILSFLEQPCVDSKALLRSPCVLGDLYSWNSLKVLPDIPSATHHVNGKGGLEASQGAFTPSSVRMAVLIAESHRRLQWRLGIHLAFMRPLIVKGSGSGTGACLLDWAPSQGFFASFLFSPFSHAYLTRSALPECYLVKLPNCLKTPDRFCYPIRYISKK